MVELPECASPGLGPGCLLWYIRLGAELKCVRGSGGAAAPGIEYVSQSLPITGSDSNDENLRKFHATHPPICLRTCMLPKAPILPRSFQIQHNPVTELLDLDGDEEERRRGARGQGSGEMAAILCVPLGASRPENYCKSLPWPRAAFHAASAS